MRNALEELKKEEAKRKTDYQAIKTTPMKLRYQGHINYDKPKGLASSKEETHQEPMTEMKTTGLMTARKSD